MSLYFSLTFEIVLPFHFSKPLVSVCVCELCVCICPSVLLFLISKIVLCFNLYAEYIKWFWFQKVFLYAVLECQVLCYCLKSLSVFPNNSTSQEPPACFLLVPLLLSLAWLWHNSRLLSHPSGSVYWQKKTSSERMRNEMYLSHCLPSIFRNVLSFFYLQHRIFKRAEANRRSVNTC